MGKTFLLIHHYRLYKNWLKVFVISSIVAIVFYTNHVKMTIRRMRNKVKHCASPINDLRLYYELPYWDKNVLVDLGNFRFLILHKICQQPLDFLTVIVSAPGNFDKRSRIRLTWGRKRAGVRFLFMLGAVENKEIQRLIDEENVKYRDIIQGNFIDSYRNLTYKYVMILKYVVYHCPRVPYVLKLDDDVYVNIEDVLQFMKELRVYNRERHMVLCNIYVNGTVIRNDSRWAVTKDEYENEIYTEYCQGAVVIFKQEALFRIYKYAQVMHYFWIDDVHITGTIARLTGVDLSQIGPACYLQHRKIKHFFDGLATQSVSEIVFFVYIDTEESFYKAHGLIERRNRVVQVLVDKLRIT